MDTSTVVAQAALSTDTLGRRIVRRRFRTGAEKRRIVQELIDSGCSGAEVARRHGVNANLIFNWRRLHEQGLLGSQTRRSGKPGVKLLAVQIDADRPAAPAASRIAYLEIELPGGIRVRSVGAWSPLTQALTISAPRAAACTETVAGNGT